MEINLGKTKKKTHSEVRFLQGELNRKDKEISNKNKIIKELKNQLRDLGVQEVDPSPEIDYLLECQNCGKGKLIEVFAVSNKVFYNCNHCNERTTINVNNEEKN